MHYDDLPVNAKKPEQILSNRYYFQQAEDTYFRISEPLA